MGEPASGTADSGPVGLCVDARAAGVGNTDEGGATSFAGSVPTADTGREETDMTHTPRPAPTTTTRPAKAARRPDTAQVTLRSAKDTTVLSSPPMLDVRPQVSGCFTW